MTSEGAWQSQEPLGRPASKIKFQSTFNFVVEVPKLTIQDLRLRFESTFSYVVKVAKLSTYNLCSSAF